MIMFRFLLTFVFCCVSLLGSAQSISDFFKQFPYKQPGTQFKDLPNNRLYASNSDNFINIENIADMTTEQSFIAFTKADGSKIFGYRYYENGGTEYESVYSTRFYKQEKGKWVEVPEVLLLLGYDTFWGTNTPLPPKEYLHKFVIDYLLPRSGNTMLVRLRVQPIFPEDNLDKVKLQQYAKSFRYGQIQLIWNPQKGIFELGKKL
jgi:hypothetical protein